MGAHGIQNEKINVGPYGKNKEMYMHIFEKEGLLEIVAGLTLEDTLVNSPLQSKNENGPDPVFTHLLNSLGPKGLRAQGSVECENPSSFFVWFLINKKLGKNWKRKLQRRMMKLPWCYNQLQFWRIMILIRML